MKKLAIVIVLVMSLAFLGCAGMTDTQQRTLSGSAMGAVAGTAIGAMSGHASWGAVIGAASTFMIKMKNPRRLRIRKVMKRANKNNDRIDIDPLRMTGFITWSSP